MFKDLKQRRRLNRARPGDHSPLPAYRFWQLYSRSLFFIELPEESGRSARYEVDVRLMAEEDSKRPAASLYRDGSQVLRAKVVPVVFPVPGGQIEIETSMVGIKRVHYVAEDGTETMLSPDPRSTEGRRASFQRNHRLASGLIGLVSMIILLAGLALTLAAALEGVTGAEPIAENIGTFHIPDAVPDWLNWALPVAAAFAGAERAAALRTRWADLA